MPYGYTAAGVSQKFTGKERDNETSLDFFEARYFASTQGRFTSADPLLSSGKLPSPQTWNRYSYTLNNPLRLIDPTGMFIIDPSLTEEQRNDILTSYVALKSSLNRKGLSMKDRARIERSLKLLGEPGVDNGVTVTIGTASSDAGAETNPNTHNAGQNRSRTNPLGLHITITFNQDWYKQKTITDLSETLGHEAIHADDFKKIFQAGFRGLDVWREFNKVRYNSEFEAYSLSGAVIQALSPSQTLYYYGNTPNSWNKQRTPFNKARTVEPFLVRC